MPPQRTMAQARWRRSSVLNHMIAYFTVMVIVTPINAWLDPATPWFLLPAVAWGAPLAVHVAWAMGLFDRKR